jgi:hypothetical protein
MNEEMAIGLRGKAKRSDSCDPTIFILVAPEAPQNGLPHVEYAAVLESPPHIEPERFAHK